MRGDGGRGSGGPHLGWERSHTGCRQTVGSGGRGRSGLSRIPVNLLSREAEPIYPFSFGSAPGRCGIEGSRIVRAADGAVRVPHLPVLMPALMPRIPKGPSRDYELKCGAWVIRIPVSVVVPVYNSQDSLPIQAGPGGSA